MVDKNHNLFPNVRIFAKTNTFLERFVCVQRSERKKICNYDHERLMSGKQ